jgi:hypothetical protein
MGLDQFAYRVKRGFIKKPVDFETSVYDEETEEDTNAVETVEFKYWRKHPALQGWMEELYYNKGGESEQFNCVNVQLTWEDLEDLEHAIKNNILPETKGFFFGNDSSEDYKEDDLQFIEDALEAIKDGDDVYYSSWW